MSRFSAQQAIKKQHTALIDVFGEPLTVTFRPYSIAEKKAIGESIKESVTGGDDEVTQFLADVLISWDLPTSDEDPTPFPTDYESLCQLPAEFIGAVWAGIRESRSAGK